MSLCLIKHNHAMEMYVGVEVWLHASIISELDACEWSASRPLLLYSMVELSIWYDAGLAPFDAAENVKISCFYEEPNPESFAFRSVAQRYTDRANLAA
jgi:hypothetical protein